MMSSTDGDMSLRQAKQLLRSQGGSVIEILYEYYLVEIGGSKFEMSEIEVEIFANGLAEGLKLAGRRTG